MVSLANTCRIPTAEVDQLNHLLNLLSNAQDDDPEVESVRYQIPMTNGNVLNLSPALCMRKRAPSNPISLL